MFNRVFCMDACKNRRVVTDRRHHMLYRVACSRMFSADTNCWVSEARIVRVGSNSDSWLP